MTLLIDHSNNYKKTMSTSLGRLFMPEDVGNKRAM